MANGKNLEKEKREKKMQGETTHEFGAARG